VPITRGKERSRPYIEIIDECVRLADAGVKEVTLLGQTVNSYGKHLDSPCSFAQLLERVNAIHGIERIRFTSPYPKDFNSDVIDAIAALPKVMPQIHMPVQVGDDNLLKRMHRGYTLDQYRQVIGSLRESVPDVAVTTDLMLGFPGETEEEFQNTLSFVSEMRFDSAYMFAYSPREGTKAALLPDQLTQKEKVRRLEAVIDIQNRITLEVNKSQVGRQYPVLVEGRSSKDAQRWTGLTPQGKTMNFESTLDALIGNTILVEAVESHLWGYSGRSLDIVVNENSDKLAAV
jgi:tRNA-2-methylthio-N6-dimethylallyladenosine synthase